MDINNLIREYMCLVEELDRLKKLHDSADERIKELSIKVEYYEKLINILKENLDIEKEYKDDLKCTLKQLAVLFGIDIVAILSGVLNNNPDASIMMMAFTGAAPVASANILKAKTDKKAQSQNYKNSLEYLNELDDSYKKDKWELEQLEIERDNLFDCYLKQLELVTSKRRELANATYQERMSSIKRIRKIEK